MTEYTCTKAEYTAGEAGSKDGHKDGYADAQAGLNACHHDGHDSYQHNYGVEQEAYGAGYDDAYFMGFYAYHIEHRTKPLNGNENVTKLFHEKRNKSEVKYNSQKPA